MSETDTSFPWFRFWNETVSDDKIEMIADEADMPFALVLGCWAIILTLASMSPVRGALYVTEEIGHTPLSISKKLKISQKKTENFLKILENFGLISKNFSGIYYIVNWEKRQPKSDNVNIRVRKYRERENQEDVDSDNETLQKRFCNAPELESDTELNNTLLSGENSPQTDQQITDKEFVGKFLSVSGIEFLENNQQGVRLVEFRYQYGDKKIMSFAEWANDKRFASMEKALKSMQTALPDWNDPPPKKEKTFARANKKKTKTVADDVPEQTEEQVRSIAQQLFESNKAKEAEEARNAWIRQEQLVDA